MTRTTQTLLTVFLLLVAVSCSRPDLEPGQVAALKGHPVTKDQVLQYLNESLSPEDEPDTALSNSEPEELDQVRSRLFDIMIDELLLAGEAERRHGPGPDAFDLLFEELAAEAGEPDPVDVDALVEERSEELHEDRTLLLRALMFPDRAVADNVYDQVRRKRITFDEAVAAHESTPGQGMAMETSLGTLPEVVCTAINDLPAGRISRPVEVNNNIYIFLVEAWRDAVGQEEGNSLREEARAELRSRMIQEATGHLLKELRNHPKVRIETNRLPFTYVPEPEVQVE